MVESMGEDNFIKCFHLWITMSCFLLFQFTFSFDDKINYFLIIKCFQGNQVQENKKNKLLKHILLEINIVEDFFESFFFIIWFLLEFDRNQDNIFDADPFLTSAKFQ